MRRLDAPPFLDVFEPDFVQDARGRLLTPISDRDLQDRRALNIHPVTFMPGTIRGNHSHPRRTETACVVAGELLACFREGLNGSRWEMRVGADAPRLFVMRPGVAHAFHNVGESIAVVLCWADEPYDETDIEPAPLI